MPASATMTAPRTFRSEAALAAAVDAAFAEELAAALADPAPDRPSIVLPDAETLIRQAAIATGPCPPDPREPSGGDQLLTKASVFTLRAA
ncbi:hypothetical protein [Streptomyces sp. V1I1]|uniref:hypothetical protein n=1 Tax=Streptomyces sp. V1I1 TaxID=3042272 RepID=UPI0027843A16|nr:hypothetical protein [Streptomyces sp. V1I1]MDQ0945996.1 hypothetical protein [Streptomyces sp. V1I1]